MPQGRAAVRNRAQREAHLHQPGRRAGAESDRGGGEEVVADDATEAGRKLCGHVAGRFSGYLGKHGSRLLILMLPGRESLSPRPLCYSHWLIDWSRASPKHGRSMTCFGSDLSADLMIAQSSGAGAMPPLYAILWLKSVLATGWAHGTRCTGRRRHTIHSLQIKGPPLDMLRKPTAAALPVTLLLLAPLEQPRTALRPSALRPDWRARRVRRRLAWQPGRAELGIDPLQLGVGRPGRARGLAGAVHDPLDPGPEAHRVVAAAGAAEAGAPPGHVGGLAVLDTHGDVVRELEWRRGTGQAAELRVSLADVPREVYCTHEDELDGAEPRVRARVELVAGRAAPMLAPVALDRRLGRYGGWWPRRRHPCLWICSCRIVGTLNELLSGLKQRSLPERTVWNGAGWSRTRL